MPKRPDQRPPRILESGKESPETSRNEVSRHRAIRAPHAAAACCFMPPLIALRRRPGGRLVAQRQGAQGDRHPSAGVKVEEGRRRHIEIVHDRCRSPQRLQMIIGVIVSVTPDASANGIAKGVNTAADGQPRLCSIRRCAINFGRKLVSFPEN